MMRWLLPAIILFAVMVSIPVASADRSFQVTLNLNNTPATVYVPGEITTTGEILTPAVYTSPSHYYVCSYRNDILTGLVHFLETPYSVAINRTGATYSLSINQSFNRSSVFAVFSRSDYRRIERNINLVETGAFMNKPIPSFGFGLGKLFSIKMLLQYDNIVFDGPKTVYNKGSRNTVIANNGTVSSKASIVFEDY